MFLIDFSSSSCIVLVEGTNLHNFCQSEALPDGFLVQKVSLNVLYICDLINFSCWEMFS